MAWNSGVSPTISASNFNSPSDRYPSVLGVGHIFTTIPKSRFLPLSISRIVPSMLLDPLLPSVARGVGHNPDTFPDVGSANVNRSDNPPSRIIPHRGKITEDSGKSTSNKQR
jgi:hypothetical protein